MTKRERQVVALLMKGYRNREIAENLGISLRMARGHMGHLHKKFGIQDGIRRVKLAVKLFELGMD